jgi:hypothetical protein
MNRNLLIWAVVVIGFIAVAFLAGQIGGIAIRRVQEQGGQVAWQNLPEPFLPCVPATVHWTLPRGTANGLVEVYVHDVSTQEKVGLARVGDGRASITIPSTATTPASLFLRDQRTGEILVSQSIRLSPPGPDCLK